VVITIRGKLVFVAESFPLDLARKLTALVLDAQGTGEMHMAQTTDAHYCCHPERSAPGPPATGLRRWGGERVEGPAGDTSGAMAGNHEASTLEIGEPLTASLIRFLSNCGVMKAAVDAGISAAARK
jgi:hypothetical protein